MPHGWIVALTVEISLRPRRTTSPAKLGLLTTGDTALAVKRKENMISSLRTKLSLGVCLIIVSLCTPRAFPQAPRPKPGGQPDELHRLWSQGVDPILRQTLHTGPQAETVGTTMMLPLHAAFKLRDAQWEQAFADHFSGLVANSSQLPDEDLGRVEYLYLASEFLVLSKQTGQPDLVPKGLPELVFAQMRDVWNVKPAKQFEGPALRGVRQRTLWRLDNRQVKKTYFRQINDVELFVFAIAADLKVYGGTPAQKSAWAPTLDDVLVIARRVFTQEGAMQPDGRWVFQPGVYTDHPDYQYAGDNEVRPGIRPIPVRGIAPDTSHAHRWPLWLTSQMRAYSEGSEGYRFYEGLRNGFEKEFYEKVLVKPSSQFPCYRLTNFMDGRNGVYRWNYAGMPKDSGFGPYGNSYTLLVGWWVFADTDRMHAVYKDLLATYPWPKECIEVYLGPTTPKGHSPSDFDPNSSSMRLWHLSVWLSSLL